MGRRISNLSKGSVKEREISKQKYYYLQDREDKRAAHKYLGKNEPHDLIKQIEMRKALSLELKKVNETLKILQRVV